MDLFHPASVDTFIADRLPNWLTAASLDRVRALHLALQEQEDATHRLRQLMQHIPALDQFAVPLLSAALVHRGVQGVDVKTCSVRIRREVRVPTASLTGEPRRLVTQTQQFLLAAALHNYHIADTRPSTGHTGQLVDGQGKLLPIGFTAFAGLCRGLDLGQRYQQLLEAHLKPKDAPGEVSGAAEAQVRRLFENSIRARFEVDVRQAAMQRVLDEDSYLSLLPIMSKRPVVPALMATTAARQLYLLGKKVRGMATFEISRGPETTVIAWSPGDPQGALASFSSWQALYDEWAKRLSEPAYQAFFMRFISERDRPGFHQLLRERIAERSTSKAAELDGRYLPIDTRWDEHLAVLHIGKLFDDARVLAVPTGDEDEQDRIERLQLYAALGMELVTLAGMFLPVVGEVLLAVGALGVANEVYEGYQDWRVGDRQGALDHLFGVAENVVLGALIAKGGGTVLKALDRYAFVDELIPVRLPSGQIRLAAEDLAAYQVNDSEAQSGAGVAGQTQALLNLDDADYRVVEDHLLGFTRIRHPLRKDAYAPEVYYNRAGGAFHELEYRQRWQGSGLLLRRMKGSWMAMPDATAEQMLRITGYDQAAIRQLHLESAGPPARIADTWELYQLHEQLPELHGPSLDTELLQRELPLSETEQLLRRDFPGLSVRGVQEILSDVNDDQLDSLQQKQRVPLSLAQRARWYLRDQRLDRACAGLQWAGTENADTERLAMGLVERLAPWPKSVRIELRQGALDGRLLSQSGPADWQALHTILRREWHYHSGVSDEPLGLLEALMQTLDDEQKRALDPLADLTVDTLRARLLDAAAMDRNAAASLIGMAPADPRLRPPRRFADGRLGYLLSGRGDSSRRAITAGIHRIFPTLTEAQVEAYLAELTRRNVGLWEHYSELETQLNQLRTALRTWRGQAEGVRDTVRRHRVVQQLRRSWRRKTANDAGEYVLRITGQRVGRLPELPDGLDFAHVRRMSLTLMELTELPDNFLERFPNLLSLDLRGNRLTALPPGIEHLTELQHLLLSDNHLTAASVRGMANDVLQRLRRLDLARNPMGQVPSLSHLRNLRRVSLRNAQVAAFPSRMPPFAHYDLRENRITQLRQDVRVLRDRLQRTALHENPLDEASLRMFNEANPGAGSSGNRHRAVDDALLAEWLGPQQGAQRQRYSATWDALRAEPGSSDLFRFLADFAHGRDFERHPGHFRGRIWRLLELCEQHEPIRERLFQTAGGTATCDDRLLYMLGELEVAAQAERVLGSASHAQREPELWMLGRAYFRLDEVDRIAARHIERMRAEWTHPVDDIEVRLFYRTRLARSLGLPIEADSMHYSMFANVTNRDLVDAEDQVLAAENPRVLIDALAERSFWQAHARAQYAERFDEALERFQALQEQNLADHDAGHINEWLYNERAISLRHGYENAERELYRTLASELQQRLSV